MDLKELDELEAQLDPTARLVVKFLRASIAERDAEIARLRQQVAEFQRMLFGKRSEKLPPIESEVRRVIEADELTVEGKPMPEEPAAKKRERRRKARKKSEPERTKKRKLRERLPVVHETVVVKPEDLPEGYDLSGFREVGDGEIVRRVEHVREHLVVVEYRLQTLASHDGAHIIRASTPPSVVEGGHYGPGVYAHVITAKCDDVMPLYRIERAMERAGCPIARSTLCSFFHRGAELLTPIYDCIVETAKCDPYLHADETHLDVQHEGKCLKGWVWGLFCKKAIAYFFDESRGGDVAKRLLSGTKGFLVIDGYAGYNGVVDADKDLARIRVGCWAHTRRGFFKALSSDPEAREALEQIVELYLIEHRAAERELLGTEAHYMLRQTESRKILDTFEKWLDERSGKDPPKSPMGKAVNYAINHRVELRRFLDDAKLPLDNNFAERALRIFAIGRKNFLFAGHNDGAQNLAVLQSIVATCRLHGVNPYEYLKDVLVRIQRHPASRIDELMPWNWVPSDVPAQA
jgi:transposase